MTYPETTDAFTVTSINQWSHFTRQARFEEDDIDIAVDACGVCASDVHTITGGWNEDIPLPLCVGHETIGKVVRIGSKVMDKDIKIGDRVGVGAQVGADLACGTCLSGHENYCPNQLDAYGSKHPDGTVTQGGFSSHVRVHNHFVFRIPEKLETKLAAPLLCAGLTTYSPLKRLGAGPGKKIAICGLGGLGHLAVLWSVALGAECYVLSHSSRKSDDARLLGAKGFIDTSNSDWSLPWKSKFDLILSCTGAVDRFHLPDYFSTLTTFGIFHMVGLPDNPLLPLETQAFVPNACSLSASNIGNRTEMIEMLSLAVRANIRPWVETIDISEDGCKEAVERVHSGDVKFRFTLVGYDAVFGQRI
ncbi:unnamed protein product [Periconia digitata]|uniref:Uncharacterized protein n=1 Tax=Periconia digitata TaxID=1303443 RepID=A0A9W4UC92_9PLEO|nr:unnamed protein product [Periconia digitata]